MVHTALLALLTLAAAFQDWSNLGGSSARNGLAQPLGPNFAATLWSNAGDFSLIAWHPLVEDGRVFTVREAGFPQNGGAANDALVAYDLDTGAELWRTTLPFGGGTSVEWIAWVAGVRDGRIFASRASHMRPAPVLAHDAAGGAPLWTSALATRAFACDGCAFAPDGDLLIGGNLRIARVDAVTGATVWSTPRTCSVSGDCGPAASADAVYIDEIAAGGR